MRTSNKDRKTATLSIRTSVDLRSKLQNSLEESGRSLTQEVEMRLEKSFQTDEFVGGQRNAAFLNLLGAGVRDIELSTGQSWLEDGETWLKVAEQVVGLIEARKPDRENLAKDPVKDESAIAKRIPNLWGENGDQV